MQLRENFKTIKANKIDNRNNLHNSHKQPKIYTASKTKGNQTLILNSFYHVTVGALLPLRNHLPKVLMYYLDNLKGMLPTRSLTYRH